MYSIIAQGNGFYGVAFFTTNLSYEKLILALLNEPELARHEDGSLTINYHPDTSVYIREYKGENQEKPVILMDSGHGMIDLHTLQHVKELLDRPYVPPCIRYSQFLKKCGLNKDNID